MWKLLIVALLVVLIIKSRENLLSDYDVRVRHAMHLSSVGRQTRNITKGVDAVSSCNCATDDHKPHREGLCACSKREGLCASSKREGLCACNKHEGLENPAIIRDPPFRCSCNEGFTDMSAAKLAHDLYKN